MAKIKQFCDKQELLKRKKEHEDMRTFIHTMADLTPKQLDQWFASQFKELPKQARDGLETVVKALWANAKMLNQLGLK